MLYAFLSEDIPSNLDNFTTYPGTSPERRAAIPPSGKRSYEYINVVSNRVRHDPSGIQWYTRLWRSGIGMPGE